MDVPRGAPAPFGGGVALAIPVGLPVGLWGLPGLRLLAEIVTPGEVDDDSGV